MPAHRVLTTVILLAVMIAGGTPKHLTAAIKHELSTMGKVIEDAGIRAE